MKLPIALTPEDWDLINEISSEERIKEYAQLIAQRELPSNKPLDLEHRQYLHQRDWDLIGDLIRKYVGNLVGDRSGRAGDWQLLNGHPELDEQVLVQSRRIFCYSYNEEGVSYTLDDFFHWLNSYTGAGGGDNRRFAVDHESGSWLEGGNDYVEWRHDDNCWHFYENDGLSRRWYDDGVASPKYASMILERWLLAEGDVDDVMRTSPAQLDEILKRKAEQKPEEVQKALESKRRQNWELLESCYAEISVRLFIQLGLTSEEDIARGLEEEYLFHFRREPIICSYDSFPNYAKAHFIEGKTEGSERLFRRFQDEERAKDFLERYKGSLGHTQKAKLVLPAEGK